MDKSLYVYYIMKLESMEKQRVKFVMSTNHPSLGLSPTGLRRVTPKPVGSLHSFFIFRIKLPILGIYRIYQIFTHPYPDH